MLMEELAEKYARAIYELSKEGNRLIAVEAQLSMVSQTISGHEGLSIFLYHPRVPAEAKKSLLKSVFGQEVALEVLNFLFLVVDKRRESLLPQIIDQFVVLANEERNIVIAKVTTALALDESQQTALAQKLTAVVGKNIRLNVHMDPSIIGGVIVRMGDKLIDGSVKRQLEMMKFSLQNSKVTKIGVTNGV